MAFPPHIRSRDPRAKGTRAFTLLEVMMVTLISAFVFAGVLSAYIFLGRGLMRQIHEQGLESRSRLAMYWFTQDVASASAIAAQNPGTATTGDQFVLTIPGASNTVTYHCDWSGGAGLGILDRVSGGTTLKLLTNISAISFGYYDMTGTSVSVPSTNTSPLPSTPAILNVKQLYMTYTTTAGVKSTGSQSNLTVVSPRVIMKNKGLLIDPYSP
jgi:Tfp pilus assembly protein PilW